VKPTFIIIHHSATTDGVVNDWEAIRRYHMSWRHQGRIITEQEARQRIAAGIKGIEAPWSDIGYHYGIELRGDNYLWLTGRMPDRIGAHCKEQGMNDKSLGICVVGNYDIVDVPAEAFHLLTVKTKELMEQYAISVANVKPHREFAPYKTCPGMRFPWSGFIFYL
jgi:hypothetical protein